VVCYWFMQIFSMAEVVVYQWSTSDLLVVY